MNPSKYFLTKKLFSVIFFIVLSVITENSFSQCYNNYVGGITPTTSWQTTGSYGNMPYWSFTGYAGATYNFSNCNGTAEDTYMRIFDASMNQIAYNDDNGPYCGTSNSSLDWACSTTATYYVSITHYSCSNLSYSQPLTYKAINLPNPEMVVPATGSNSYTTCSGHLYDNGGSAGNYGSSQNGYTVIYPGNPSQAVQLTGSFTTESGYEHIYIYNGAGTGGTLLYNGGSGTGSIGTITSSAANVPLTVVFTSDGSVEYSGFDFTISCVTLCVPPGTAWTAGSNSWYVSVFDGSAGNWDYKGYYTEGNLSWNTLDRWGSGDTPSNASGYQGCAVGVEYHRTSYSRRGFPCGKYNISSPNHDDDFYVYIDVNGDGTWDWSNSWGCCSALGTFWIGWLNTNSVIRVDCIEYGGGSNSSLTLTDITPAPNTNLQLNGTSGGITVCTGQTVTVTQSDINPSDETVYYYWGTENPAGSGWSTWDICANCQINSPSFNVSFASPGRYIMHTNAYNPCGTYTTYGGNTYVITVVAPPVAGTVTLSNPSCGSTYVFSLSGNSAPVEDWEYSWNGGASWTSWGQGNVSSVTWGPGGSAGLMVRARIVSGPCVVYTNAVGPTTAPIQTGENMNCPIDLGTISGGGYSYSNTQNNGSFINDYGQASGDIYYKFTLNATYIVNLSHCGSGFDTYMYLLNSSGTVLYSNDDNGTLCSGTTASLQVTLGAGTYYLVSEGYSSNTGNINTQISLCAVSIDDGSITANGSYGSITVCPGSTVTIASVGGNTGNWCYWIDSGCNNDWDLLAGGYCNQSSFTYTLNNPGCYVFHKRHSDGCGYCWDAIHGASCGCNNCTVTVNVSSTALPSPTSVTANPATICSGGTSQLNATSVGTITWWDAPSGGSSYGTSASGANFAVSPASTTTYYAEALINSSVTGTILNSPSYSNSSSGSWTLGYSFTPSSNITVTAVRRYFGSKISIWDNSGNLLRSQAVSGADGVWTQTNLATPLNLTAGTTYRIGAYSNGGSYYWRTDLGTSFANGTINASYEIGGDAFPTSSDGVLWWFVDLAYTTGGGCTSATRTPVTVTVVPDPAATIAGTTNICEGAVANYSVSGVTGGTGSVSYQWYFKSPGGSFAPLTDGSSNAPCYASVSGATTSSLTLGLYNFASACSGYQVYCVVTYNGNGCNSATSNTITTTVSSPAGNPAVFGDGVWNVYGYNGGNIDLTGTYYGYYTESNLSYNTLDRWCTTCSPSDASGWQGCYVPVDNHVVVSKRTNFACGYYQLDMPNHDDDVRVYINGNLVWSHEPGCCDSHTNIWTGYLTSTSTIEVRHLEGGGGSHQSLTITPVGTSLSTAPSSISGSTSICSGSSTTLTEVGGNLANGAVYNWYSGSCGGTLVGTGASVTVSPSSPTTYFVRAEGTCNTTACASTDVAITTNVLLSNTLSNENCPADNNGTVNVSLSGGISNVRYIKLTQQYPEWTNLADLQVIESFTGTNLSLAATATASSIHSSGSFPASEFIDGITNDDGNMWHSGTGNAGEWIRVDLGAAKNIDFLRIYNRVGCCWFRSQNLLLQLYNASNVLIFQKNINVYENIDAPHYIDVNILDLSWSDGGTTFNRTGLDAGTYTFNYADASGCATANTQAVIGTNYTVSNAPVSITGTTTICAGGTTTLTVNGGSLGSGASWKWYTGSCGGTLVGTGISYTTPALASTTVYYVRAEGTCNNTACATITVTVSQQPTASAGGSQTICAGSTATVSGASASNGAIAWTENGAGSITSGAATLTPTYTSAPGDAGNTVTLTMTVSNSPCTAATATYTVIVKAQPTATAGGSQTICAGSNATVSGASASNGTIAWTENGAGSITSGAATLTPTYTSAAGDAGNTVTLTMTVSNSPCSAATATYTVTVAGPSASSPSALADGDYVWTGFTDQYWATPSNWVIYNAGSNNFSVASAAPLSDKNVFFRNYGAPSCVSNAAHLATGTTGSCKNITIETNLTMDASSTLNVSGNWTNNGAFGAGTGTVTFSGGSSQTIMPGGNSFNNVVINNTAAGNTDINISQPMVINGIGTFTDGIINYSGTGSLTFSNGASSNGGSATSFVNNTVSKSGTNAFIFPIGEVVGSNAYWAPVGIAAPASGSTITAQYKFDVPHDDGGNVIENYNSWMMCNPDDLHHASGVEYWKMSSDNAEPAVTLYWKDASRSQITYLPDLCVAHYEDCDGPGPGTATKWASKGGNPNAVGTLGVGGSGSVTSTIPFNSYSPVTFGTKTSSNPLPINLLSFNGSCENNKVDLTWSTATETNNDYFTIQRSINAIDWEFVRNIPGGGNSNNILFYSATDNDPYNGTSYYRLKQTDYNGQSETFSPVTVSCGASHDKQSISYYPNPFTSEVMVDLRNITYVKAVLTIYDLLGEKVYEIILTNNESVDQVVKVDLHSLPAGVYSATFNSDGYSNTSKIVKNY